MREVLVVTWKFYNTGGDWTYCLNVTKEYIKRGFKVTVLSSGVEKEEVGQGDTLLTDPLVKTSKELSTWGKVRLAYSFLRQNQLNTKQKKKLFSKNWEFVHVHSLVGGAGYFALSSLKPKIPILYTLHDYHLLCPTANGYRQGENCFDCSGKGAVSVVKNNCRGSLGESLLMWLQRKTMATRFIHSRVNYFLCPSRFMREQMLNFGYPERKLINNGYCLDESTLEEFSINEKVAGNNCIFFAGRLEQYKGIQLLIKWCVETGVKLRIAGDGSLRKAIEDDLKNRPSIVYLGQLKKEELKKEILACRAVCVPSLWNENYPFAVTESLLLGKAVLGSRRGGIPELIIEGSNGFLFEPKNSASFKKAITSLWAGDLAWGPNEIRADIIQRFDAETHVDQIERLIKHTL